MYVSTTSLIHPEYGINDPLRYIDAEMVPYMVVPHRWALAVPGIVLGCKAQVTHTIGNEAFDLVVADIGPDFGKSSIAAA